MTITLNTHIQTQIHTQRLIKIAIDSVDVAVVTRAARTIVWKWKLDTVDWLEFDHRWHHCCCCCCSSCRLVVARPSPHWPSNRQSALEWTHIIETLLAIWFDFFLFWFLLPSFYLAFFFSIAPRTFSIFQKSHCIEIRRGLGKENKQNKKRKGTRRRRRRRRRISASKRRKIVVTLSLGSVTWDDQMGRGLLAWKMPNQIVWLFFLLL